MQVIKTGKFIKKIIVHYFYSIRNQRFIYRWITNLKDTLAYLIFVKNYASKTDDKIRRKVLSDLKLYGIAFLAIDDIFPETDYLYRMKNWLNQNEINLVLKRNKKFLMSYHGNENSILDLDTNNPFIDFYLSDPILTIVCDYLGYVPQLNYLRIEKTLVMAGSGPQDSQNWHRDPEEQKMIKVFIYLNEVNENNGPFFYIKGSQPSSKSSIRTIAPQYLPQGSYPAEATVKQAIDLETIVCAKGKSGTIIFCDTAGLHRGGFAVGSERIMSTAFFPSKKWSEPAALRKSEKNHFDTYSGLAKKILQNSFSSQSK